MSNQQKKNTFYGAAAILTVSTILVKIIGAIFKIPLIAILPEEAYGDFNGAYNIYSFFLTISTAGLPVALSKTVSECHTLGRENQKHRVFRVAFCAFLFMGLFSFLCMSVFGQLVATYIIGNEKAVFCVWALAPAVLCTCCCSAFRGYAQGHSDMVPTAVSQVLEALTKLGVGLVLAWYILYLGFGSEFSAAGAIGGVLWALVPAFFKARWGTNETLFTLMMNYVATSIVACMTNIMRGQASSLGTLNKATKAGWLPVINGQRYTINIIVVLVLTFAMYAYLKYSKQGYEISVVGESENTARYAGINVSRVMIRTMLLSGAICGLCGFLVVAGKDQTISTTSAGGNGFTAIIVAWLAKFNTFYMMLISFLLIFLDRGASEIASAYSLNEYAADIITGIILFFILGSEFFINYRLVWRGHHDGKEGK